MKRRQRSWTEQTVRQRQLSEWRLPGADEPEAVALRELLAEPGAYERVWQRLGLPRLARAARLLAFWRRPPRTDDLTPAELAFRRLLADRHAYARWAAERVAEWERENVLWFQGTVDGQPVYTVSRNPDVSEQRFVRRRALR